MGIVGPLTPATWLPVVLQRRTPWPRSTGIMCYAFYLSHGVLRALALPHNASIRTCEELQLRTSCSDACI
jgi:hypothetical protein